MWKFNTPEPERGGVTTTSSGLGFVGGGDGNLRAFDAKTGDVLWKFQTGRQIAAGPTIYAINGKEYVAITVGGTATSSGGGTVVSQLQVFALGGSSTQSPAFPIAYRVPAEPDRVLAAVRHTAAPRERRGGEGRRRHDLEPAGPHDQGLGRRHVEHRRTSRATSCSAASPWPA